MTHVSFRYAVVVFRHAFNYFMITYDHKIFVVIPRKIPGIYKDFWNG